MRGILAVLWALWALALCPVGAAWAQEAGPQPFILGVAPHTSARVVITQYQPVRAALAEALGRPVEVVTAPDFTEFTRRALEQSYDMAVISGHLAELLRADAGYLPLVTYTADFLAVMVVGRDSPITEPVALNDKVVLGLDPSSLVTLWGMHWLRDHHLAPKPIQYISAADSIANLIASGQADAGFMSLANFQKLAPAVRDGLRIQERSQPMTGRVYMLNRRDAAEQDRVAAALWAFAEAPDGKAYFQDNKLEGYRAVTAADMQRMAPFSDEVRSVLWSIR